MAGKYQYDPSVYVVIMKGEVEKLWDTFVDCEDIPEGWEIVRYPTCEKWELYPWTNPYLMQDLGKC